MVNLNSHGFRDMKPQGFQGHDLNLLWSRDVIGHVTSGLAIIMVSYRWSFETNAISRTVAEIVCVKHLVKRIPVKNALIPITCFRGKMEVVAFFNFGHIAAAPKSCRVTV